MQTHRSLHKNTTKHNQHITEKDVQQCKANGHYYEIINAPMSLEEAEVATNVKISNNFFSYKGVQGHIAMPTSKEEMNCLQNLCRDTPVWIGAKRLNATWIWNVSDTPEQGNGHFKQAKKNTKKI